MYCANPDCPDRQATGRPGEYRQGVERCPYCGEVLSPQPPPTGSGESGTAGGAGPHREVVVLATRELPLADIACATLEEAGIPHLRRTRGGALVVAGAAHLAPIPGEEHRVAVAEDDAVAARELLEGIAEPLRPEEGREGERPDAAAPEPGAVRAGGRGGAVLLLLAAAVFALVLISVLRSW